MIFSLTCFDYFFIIFSFFGSFINRLGVHFGAASPVSVSKWIWIWSNNLVANKREYRNRPNIETQLLLELIKLTSQVVCHNVGWLCVCSTCIQILILYKIVRVCVWWCIEQRDIVNVNLSPPIFHCAALLDGKYRHPMAVGGDKPIKWKWLTNYRFNAERSACGKQKKNGMRLLHHSHRTINFSEKNEMRKIQNCSNQLLIQPTPTAPDWRKVKIIIFRAH